MRSLATGEITLTLAAPSGSSSGYLYVAGGAGLASLDISETHIVATDYTRVLNVDGVNYTGVVHVWDLAGNVTNTFVSPSTSANMGGTHFGSSGVVVEGDVVVTSQWVNDSQSMPTTTTSDALHFYSIGGNSHTHTATFSNSSSTTINQAWGSLVRYNEGVAGATFDDRSPYQVQTFLLGLRAAEPEKYLAASSISTTTYTEATSSLTMSSGNTYILDTSSAITVTLPASAAIGDKIGIIDGTGGASSNNITVARNSHKIQGLSEDMTVANNRAAFELVYYNATNGWLLTSV